MVEKILCVDDEVNILLAHQRHLRKWFHLDSALGAEWALAALEREGPYAVIVTDLQMPGMNGLELLARVRVTSPDTVRIVLTGHADLSTAIAAVNQGSIFRFLTKPSSADDLAAALGAAVEQYRLITAERDLLEGTLRGSVKILTEMLSLVHPAAFSRAGRIHRYVHHMASQLRLRNIWQYDVAAMLSQIGCITMEPGALDRIYIGEGLSDEEKKVFASHPAAGGELLGCIPRLEPVARMIAGQNLAYGQQPAGPGRHEQDDVVMGTQLLRAAIDYDQSITRGRSHAEALAHMRRHPEYYAPSCLEALAEFVAPEGGMEVRVLKSTELSPAMIVDQDVRAKDGLLLLAKGQEVTRSVLSRLKSFAAKVGIAEPIRVLILKPESVLPHAAPRFGGSASPNNLSTLADRSG